MPGFHRNCRNNPDEILRLLHEQDRMDTVPTTTTSIDRAAILRRLGRLTRLMDSAVKLPGTRFRLGLDPLLGLIPGAGDAVSALVSLHMIHQARKLGVSRRILAAMAVNAAADALLGLVPVLGDLFDFAFKANTRNLKLLEKHLADGKGKESDVHLRSWAGSRQARIAV